MNDKRMPNGTWSIEINFCFRSLVALISGVLLIIIAALYMSKESIVKSPLAYHKQKQKINDDDDDDDDDGSVSSCNLFSGRWIYDNKSDPPPYSGLKCSFMDDGMACDKYGRKNLNYQYWRWQPHDCDLPRFNAIALLEKLRNKRLVFVGDSINRNQWVSMVCLLESKIPPTLKYVHFNGSLVTFKATEFNTTVDFYWSPLLVESNCDDPSYHRVSDRIIRVQAIEKHAKHWRNADILVFNSYIWWRWLKLKILWGSFESEDGISEDVEMLRAYEMALKTWSDWLDIHVNHTRTQLFFVSMSPTHDRAEEWGMAKGGNCYNETEPIVNEEYWGMDSDPKMMRLVEAAIARLSARGLKVHMLNITQLSEYRKEAHSSIYRKHWNPLTKEQLLNPSSYADCMHWCLPGVPDVWNTLLYAKLFYP